MWAYRCQLELAQHTSAAFTTLTYSDENLPPTLCKRDLQLFLKRLRKLRAVRFFACGEYGERNQRPHYHSIIYGVDERDRDLVEDTWGLGRTQTVNVTPATIAYTAGYAAKKFGFRKGLGVDEKIDVATGIISQWQHPFIQMSRRPGIGGAARQYINSWRSYAVSNGYKMPVPRYLHQAWKDQASTQQLEDLLLEKSNLAANKDVSLYQLEAAEQIALAEHALQSEKRKL